MKSYRSTIRACFMGGASQAVVNTFIPLLFLTFQRSYGIPLTKITLLITVNFALQLVIDLLSVTFVDKIGYRASAVLAHICTALGLASLDRAAGDYGPVYGHSDRHYDLCCGRRVA